MWEMYDEYCKDFERQRVEESAKVKAGTKKAAAAAAAANGGPVASSSGAGSSAVGSSGASSRSSGAGHAEPWAAGSGVSTGLNILDRMVTQNTFADIFMDFKYWDDTSDAFRCGCDAHEPAIRCSGFILLF
jgi:dynein intermediate chain 1